MDLQNCSKINTAFTIASEKYLPQALTLAESVLATNDAYQVVVFIFGEATAPAGKDPRIRFLQLEELDIPEFPAMKERYDGFQFSCAVKPFLAEWIFNGFNDTDKVFYFDSDIYVFGSLVEAERELSNRPILLTPHILSSIPDDGRIPADDSFLATGIFNAGFLALSRDAKAFEFLNWWKSKLLEKCLVDPVRNYFVDQKWLDLVPALFNDYCILKHPGYNVAYWNLHERKITGRQIEFQGNHYPMIFFHYSGFRFQKNDFVQGYQDRFVVHEYYDLNHIFTVIKQSLLRNGWVTTDKPEVGSPRGKIMSVVYKIRNFNK